MQMPEKKIGILIFRTKHGVSRRKRRKRKGATQLLNPAIEAISFNKASAASASLFACDGN